MHLKIILDHLFKVENYTKKEKEDTNREKVKPPSKSKGTIIYTSKSKCSSRSLHFFTAFPPQLLEFCPFPFPRMYFKNLVLYCFLFRF